MAEDHQEFELKFTGSPTDIAALPQSPGFSALSTGKGEWERLDTTYYDTPEGDLAARGVSLRLREEQGKLIQAVKRNRERSGVRRDEIETLVARTSVFPVHSGDTDADPLIDKHHDRLKPIARTITDRWATAVSYRKSRLELSIDLGRAECLSEPRHMAPLAELEIELIEGDPVHVFDVARLLTRYASLRLCTQSKLETALALGKPNGLYGIGKPPRIAANADTPVSELLQQNLAAIAVRMASLQPALVDARRVEGLHQMRVSLRRLRALERIFRPYLGKKGLADLAIRARAFAKRLEAARDWDVFLEETLPAVMDSDVAPQRSAAFKSKAQADRAKAWANAARAISSPEFTLFLIDLMEAAVLAPWRKKAKQEMSLAVSEFAPRVIDRALRKADRTSRRIRLDHAAELHELRIALKKLRYPLQMFRDAYPKGLRKSYMALLSTLQDKLGAVNDAVVAQRLADDAAAGTGDNGMRLSGFVSGYKAAEAASAACEIEAAWAAFSETQPFWRQEN